VKIMYFDPPAEGVAPVVAPQGGVGALLAANGVAALALGILPDGLMGVCRDAILKALAS
jgi:NADH-quinone oxidoreductase subunit N